jgi:primosomal replication protein N
VANKVELCGRIANSPALRVTPAGTPVLRITVDCGARQGELLLAVVMTGECARELAPRLSAGAEVSVRGSLFAVHRRTKAGLASAGIELVAEEIEPVRTIA